ARGYRFVPRARKDGVQHLFAAGANDDVRVRDPALPVRDDPANRPLRHAHADGAGGDVARRDPGDALRPHLVALPMLGAGRTTPSNSRPQWKCSHGSCFRPGDTWQCPTTRRGGICQRRISSPTSHAAASYCASVYGSRPSLQRSEEHTSELQSRENLVCRLLLEKKKTNKEKS